MSDADREAMIVAAMLKFALCLMAMIVALNGVPVVAIGLLVIAATITFKYKGGDNAKG